MLGPDLVAASTRAPVKVLQNCDMEEDKERTYLENSRNKVARDAWAISARANAGSGTARERVELRDYTWM